MDPHRPSGAMLQPYLKLHTFLHLVASKILEQTFLLPYPCGIFKDAHKFLLLPKAA
jgi:hypothetical protein